MTAVLRDISLRAVEALSGKDDVTSITRILCAVSSPGCQKSAELHSLRRERRCMPLNS